MSDADARLTPLVETLGNHPVSRELAFGDSWDGGDVWGSAMGEGFALCDWMTFELWAGDLIPESLGYTPSMCGADEEDYMWQTIVELWPTSGLTAEDVADYLVHLNALLDECRALGFDY